MANAKRRSASESACRKAFKEACQVLVGGVNSPVRSYNAVGGCPRFITSAKGSKVTDVDGRQYIDFVGGYGPMIVGHAHPKVVAPVRKAAGLGTCYGAPTRAETDLAEMIAHLTPTIQKVRFVSSGTEAVMSAIRLARGATGRNKIIKCRGCYHGHADALLVAAGSGATTLGVPSSPGVPSGATADTILVPYNDLAAVEKAFVEHGDDIAAMLVEPVAGNMGVVLPAKGYLPGLRKLCSRHGALLIFDEVMTGFRLSDGGAQKLFGVRPDLTTLGKVIGGGLPVGAFGGPARIMNHLAPLGPVYQAGTLSGNPLAMAAGLATMRLIQQKGFYETLEAKSARIEAGLREAIDDAGLANQTCLNRAGSMLTLFFTPGPVTDYRSATAADTKAFAAFFWSMMNGGVNLPPSQFEAWFVSSAHSPQDIRRTIETARTALAKAKSAANP